MQFSNPVEFLAAHGIPYRTLLNAWKYIQSRLDRCHVTAFCPLLFALVDVPKIYSTLLSSRLNLPNFGTVPADLNTSEAFEITKKYTLLKTRRAFSKNPLFVKVKVSWSLVRLSTVKYGLFRLHRCPKTPFSFSSYPEATSSYQLKLYQLQL